MAQSQGLLLALVAEGVHHRPRDLEGLASGPQRGVSHASHLLDLVLTLQVRDHQRGHGGSLLRVGHEARWRVTLNQAGLHC